MILSVRDRLTQREENMDINKPLRNATERVQELMEQGMTMVDAIMVQRAEAIEWGVANGRLATKPGRKK
jgi:hypothetical protein